MVPLSALERSIAEPTALEIVIVRKLCTSTIRVVPGLQKTIEKVVMLLRRGDRKSESFQ